MNVARVRDGVVINVELWESLDDAQETASEGETLVPFADDVQVVRGLNYDPVTGFEERLVLRLGDEQPPSFDAIAEQEARLFDVVAELNNEIMEREIGMGYDVTEQFAIAPGVTT